MGRLLTVASRRCLPAHPFAAGFKKLVKDANLELKVYDMEQMSKLFMQKGGAKGIGSSQDETLSLGVEQFITLMVHLAFGRDNPRYVAAKESKKEETVPVLQCVQNLMNEFLPRMHKGNSAEFRSAQGRLRGTVGHRLVLGEDPAMDLEAAGEGRKVQLGHLHAVHRLPRGEGLPRHALY